MGKQIICDNCSKVIKDKHYFRLALFDNSDHIREWESDICMNCLDKGLKIEVDR